ncbi:hypothetical protein NPA08_03135 [Mycoplasmopsis citelli]|uniref:Lipoprotein n=1 Tax=Mycoplasmopsis citelli TaxID=171281 RepID=A0A449B1I7_9BACT|nr:hypothetical protein [Mycoplasmopsis citelli]UUD35929.1 hypothetical protein NPA08_03135 [Mycoplasmopsis citelli]VEU74468.1 Uncharacterised protein [Mycoplasmopsis citelli]
MSLKSKLFKNILVGFSTPLLPLITVSCTLGRETNKGNYSEYADDKIPYFINLLRLKQDEQGIKTNNSIIFDQFIGHSDLKQKEKEFNHFIEDFKVLIKSKQDFSNYITKKINLFYQKLQIPKTLSDAEIQKIFETDFLNGQNIDDILKNNNILVLESTDDRSPIGLKYAIKEEKEDHINIWVINPSQIDHKGGLHAIPHLLDLPEKSVFNVIIVPKEKRIEFKETITDDNNQLFSDLYNQYAHKPENFYDWFHERSEISEIIMKIQNKQGIFNKENFILKDLTNDSLSELPLVSKVNIIKNANEFNEFVIVPIQKVAQKLNHPLTIDKITNDFEKNYLNAQKLNEVLKTHDIVVQRLIQKANKPSNRPAKLIKMLNSTASQINLAFIDEREFNFNFKVSDDTWKGPLAQKPRIFYQGLLVPKGSQVKINSKLNFKETNDFLLANKSLYEDKKPVE